MDCSTLSNTESMANTILRTGLKRKGLTLLLIIYNIFVDIKIIAAYSARICKQTTITVNKEILQTHVDNFHLKNIVPYVSKKKLQKMNFHQTGMISKHEGICKQLSAGRSSLKEAPSVLSLT